MMYEFHHCAGCFLVRAATVKSRPVRCPTCLSMLPVDELTVRTLDDYLSESRSTRNALLIKPTRGAFKDYKAKQDLHIGLTDSQGNLVEFNENGLQFGTTEWVGCFELASIDVLISDSSISDSQISDSPISDSQISDSLVSDCSDHSVRKHPGQGPVNDVSDCPNGSNDDSLIGNFTSLNLAEKGPSADPLANSANSQTKDRLTGFAIGSSFATSSKETTIEAITEATNQATNEVTTKLIIETTKRTNKTTNTTNKTIAETTNKINKTIDKMTRTPLDKTEMRTESYQAGLLANYWDYTLAICQRDPLVQRTFNAKTYNESENNCLSFVCFFFKLLDLEQFKELTNKTVFCERFVKPRLSELFKIIEFSRSDSNGYLPVRADFHRPVKDDNTDSTGIVKV